MQPCRNVCEIPRCDWHCSEPLDCPEPRCHMVCEPPKQCQHTTYHEHLPPKLAHETAVLGFRAPAVGPAVPTGFETSDGPKNTPPVVQPALLPLVSAQAVQGGGAEKSFRH